MKQLGAIVKVRVKVQATERAHLINDRNKAVSIAISELLFFCNAKLSLLVHFNCHKPECIVKFLDCCGQGQGQSEC